MVEYEHNFEHDRKIESEAYAIINFFQAYTQATLAGMTKQPEIAFIAIGGNKTMEKLIMNCKDNFIDIFNNSIGSLFQQLEDRINYMNQITVSKSVLTIEATDRFKTLKELYSSESGIKEEAYLDLFACRAIPDDKMLELSKLKPKSKKIGER